MALVIRPPYWVTLQRTPTCRAGHPYISFRENPAKMVLEVRGDAHLFLTCHQCHTHSLGVQSAGHQLIHMYDCTSEQLNELQSWPHSARTWDMLVYLGYAEEPAA